MIEAELLKECLLSKIKTYGILWKNKMVEVAVYNAVKNEDFDELIDIISEQMDILNLQKERLSEQEERLSEQEERIADLEKEVRHMLIAKVPAALRRDLDVTEMYALYQTEKSFRKVGNIMGCDGKTVKNRLRDAGYKI